MTDVTKLEQALREKLEDELRAELEKEPELQSRDRKSQLMKKLIALGNLSLIK